MVNVIITRCIHVCNYSKKIKFYLRGCIYYCCTYATTIFKHSKIKNLKCN